MKKIIALALSLLLLIAIPCEAFAELPDFAAMSDEELKEIVDAARNELAIRGLNLKEDTLLFEQDGVQVFLTGEHIFNDYGENKSLEIEVIMINDSEYTLSLSGDYASMNGWSVYFYGFGGVAPGKKKKATIEFDADMAEVETFEEIEDVEVTFRLFDEVGYETVATIDPVTIYLNT